MLVGGVLARQMVRSRLRRTNDRAAFAELAAAVGLIDRRLVIPGSSLAVLVGIGLAWMTGAPFLGFLQGAERNWLLVANLLIIFGMLVVLRIFLPVRRQVETWLEQSAPGDPVPDRLLEVLNNRKLQSAYLLEAVSLLVVVALMVFKPF